MPAHPAPLGGIRLTSCVITNEAREQSLARLVKVGWVERLSFHPSIWLIKFVMLNLFQHLIPSPLEGEGLGEGARR